jgi:hypothetical protein
MLRLRLSLLLNLTLPLAIVCILCEAIHNSMRRSRSAAVPS